MTQHTMSTPTNILQDPDGKNSLGRWLLVIWFVYLLVGSVWAIIKDNLPDDAAFPDIPAGPVYVFGAILGYGAVKKGASAYTAARNGNNVNVEAEFDEPHPMN